MNQKRVVIVVPLLNEEENIGLFITEVRRAISNHILYELSFLFIDDGSTDASWRILTQFAKKDSHIKALKLSRNFGSHTAWYAGLSTLVAKKQFDYIVLTTIDLQDPPALIPQLLKHLKNGVRLAWAIRKQRQDGSFNTWFSQVYYALVRRFALPTMPTGGMDFCAFDRKVSIDLVHVAEKNTSLLGLILWLGYPHVYIPYIRQERQRGKSHWSIAKKLKLFVDTFVAFSYAPIRLSSYLGFVISGLGFIYAGIILIRRLLYGAPIEGWSSLMLVVLLLSGVQLIMVGVVAEYLWRTLDETRKRPMYVIDKQINI